MAKTVRETVRVLEERGWEQVRQRGSHRVLRHRRRPGLVVVPGRLAQTIPVGTLASIGRATGLEELG